MSEKSKHTVKELVLNNLLVGKSKELGDDWFVYFSGLGNGTSLLHICKPRFWVNAMSEVFRDKEGNHTSAYDTIAEYLKYVGADANGKCKCGKKAPDRVQSMYRLMTLGLKNG